MIHFERVYELPEEAPKKAQWQAERSMMLWRVRYVWENEFPSHTYLGTFGFVPLCYLSRKGYFWLAPETQHATRAILREAKRAFIQFSSSFDWDTFVFTEVDFTRGLRFAQFMGFKQGHSDEYYTYLTREK